MTEAITKYTTDAGVEIALSPSTVRDYLVSGDGKVSEQEVVMFLELCRAQRLNPFLREAYLIKFGTGPASIVTGKDTFLKRAEHHSQFDGFEAGITVLDKDGEIVRRDGSLYGATTERLVGGWARVHRKDRTRPFFAEVALTEYIGLKSDGKPNRQWERMPATMIRKVPLVQALREAFPETFGGLYSPEEISTVDMDQMPSAPVDVPGEEGSGEYVVMASNETLEKIRTLKDGMGIGDDLYLKQLETAQRSSIASDTELTAEAAAWLLYSYEQRKAALDTAAAEAELGATTVEG